jgi:hypothetical protein
MLDHKDWGEQARRVNEDYMRRRIVALESVLNELIADHWSRSPSFVRDAYIGGCGCYFCQKALEVLGEFEHCDNCESDECARQRRCHRAEGHYTLEKGE